MPGSRHYAVALVVLTLCTVCACDVNIVANFDGASSGHEPTPAQSLVLKGDYSAVMEGRPVASPSRKPGSNSGDARLSPVPHPSPCAFCPLPVYPISRPSLVCLLLAASLCLCAWSRSRRPWCQAACDRGDRRSRSSWWPRSWSAAYDSAWRHREGRHQEPRLLQYGLEKNLPGQS